MKIEICPSKLDFAWNLLRLHEVPPPTSDVLITPLVKRQISIPNRIHSLFTDSISMPTETFRANLLQYISEKTNNRIN